MRSKKFHGLKRIKLRQDWNKYNLYNLSRAQSPVNSFQTFYQQKWKAKSATRAYHGETLREKPWTKIFKPSIRAVIPMDVKVLARSDGSEQAAGRGSGIDTPDGRQRRKMRTIPYMNMTFAAMERRLDTAIFRALFASSTKQARQFVVHGCVKVNGKKMIYPGYQLNPGDMFQVEPNRVLFATGAKKSGTKEMGETGSESSEGLGEESAEEDQGHESSKDPTDNVVNAGGEEINETSEILNPKLALKDLLAQSRSILSSDNLSSAKRKREFRDFQSLVRKALSRKETEPTFVGELSEQLSELISKLNIDVAGEDSATPTQSTPGQSLTITNHESKQLEQALSEVRENPYDPSKPWATPWRPRDYMSAFAFVPRYLEVHHSICSAVYLRHPVVRPGLAEVPTPFSTEILGLAFNWYLRRR